MQSYDRKDWDSLRQILAPSVRLDFRSLQGELHEQLSPESFAAIIADKKLLGDEELKSQHFIGATKWELLGDGSIKVENQIRVAHQRYTDKDLSTVKNKGHAHGVTTHWYRKIDGVWKLEAVEPRLEWFEYDLFGTLNPEE